MRLTRDSSLYFEEISMENCKTLPAGYREIFKINLQKDKKTAVLINAMALVIMILMLIPAFLTADVSNVFSVFTMPHCTVLIGGMILYLILHELVHGIFMKKFSGVKPKYGFTGLYAYAGSSAYFNRKCYIIIALAPVVIWGIVLAVLQICLCGIWAWIIYFIQIANISGAAGDIYVTCKMSRMPENILVNDTGIEMTIYSE